MSQNPKMTAQWMDTMMPEAQFHDQVMDYMAKNPEQMNQWMTNDPRHIEEMATAMKENHDFMMAMMLVMMNDPALRLQMLGHMTENPESMEQMKKMMGQNMMGSEMISPAADAHTITDDIDKSFVLCAIETDGQSIYPDNDIDGLIVGSSDGVFYPESWTFALIDADDIEEVDVEDYPEGLRDHDTVNGQDHTEAHYNCNDDAVAAASAPGPSISVDIGDVVQITLVSDIDNVHMHSIDQHALNGDEHVNSGPIQQGHQKTWVWKSDQAGSFLYHCAANGLMNLWEHINNGMYGNIVVSPTGNDDDAAVEYSVMFADMYTMETDDGGSEPANHEFDLGAFVAGDNNIMVTNGEAFNYAPFIGAEWGDGEHHLVILNPLDVFGDPQVLNGVPLVAPINEITRWYITNPGPNNFLAWHFIAGQMDVRDGSTPQKLMTPVANEETWTVPPGSSSTTDTVFPSVGPYIGITHKLNDVVKGGAFAVIACDVDNPENNEAHPLAEFVCNDVGGFESIEDIIAFNAAVNPKVIVKEI